MRKIIHIDMDAFFASIEQRDDPNLRGKPVVVGGDPHKRGVVATCSYEARKYGIRSAMPSRKAFQLCPQAIFIHPRFERYKEVSLKIRDIFLKYTDLVEPLSLDEAYLDVTNNKKNEPSATRLAQQIKRQIFEETSLTASAGVSFNKFLAKTASDCNKPDGLTVIPPEKAEAFIDHLPIGSFYGVGKVTEQKMMALGIRTGADLKKKSHDFLLAHFGKMGGFFYQLAHCKDDRPVSAVRVRKSVGKEITFPEDIDDKEQMVLVLHELAQGIAEFLKKRSLRGRTVSLKVRYADFKTITRAISLSESFQEGANIAAVASKLLEKTEAGIKKVRLLGISISNLS